MKFNNSAEFREYLQDLWHTEKPQEHDTEQLQWSEDFINISKDRGLKYGIDIAKGKYRKNHYNQLINEYISELIPLLAENQAQEIETNISIGSVNSNSINAVCITDKNGNYAVIINSSIFTYLHKYGKFLLALENPSIVIYCNRKDAQELIKEDIREFLNELPKIYFAIHEPKGPMIHLKDDFALIHMKILEIAEKFILGHELGHYFCGHLYDQSNTEIYLNDLEKLKNDNHKIEFEADDFGFLLITDNRNKYPNSLITSAIILLFQGLDSLNSHASESHPAPIERMKRLLLKIGTR